MSQKVKIAVVDDHRLFRQGLIQILVKNPWYEVVIEAASAEEFLDRLAADTPDVVLLDLQMKGKDGKETSQILLAQYPDIKIIILSMHYSDEFILDLMRTGVHGFLPKDTDQAILTEAITQVTSRGYYLDETIIRVMREGLQQKTPPAQKVSFNGLHVDLSEREMDVLRLLCEGYNTQRIADTLFISYRTVEGHRKNLLEKTGASNSVSLVMYAVRSGLVSINK